jgi:predicted PhzF superfamily epimerase YddE/YHI9
VEKYKMEKYPLYIVDVFAEQKYAGNQLAVFINAKTPIQNKKNKNKFYNLY